MYHSDAARTSERRADDAGAVEHYTKALDIQESQLGCHHPLTAATYDSMAVVYVRQGQYAQALDCYGKALAFSEGRLGPTHVSTLNTAYNMAAVHEARGDAASMAEKCIPHKLQNPAICAKIHHALQNHPLGSNTSRMANSR